MARIKILAGLDSKRASMSGFAPELALEEGPGLL